MAKTYIGSGLEIYHKTMREAKAHGGDYEKYVKQYYKVSKKLRTHSVKLKETGARVLNYEQFRINTMSENINVNKLVAEQFGLISGNEARVLQLRLKEKGYSKVSIQRAMTRQLSSGEWNVIDEYYQELKSKGYSSTQASNEISIYFFGS